MKLVVVSYTPHFRTDSGVVGWGPTIREIDYLASLFAEVAHLAPLLPGPPSQGELAHEATNVRLVSLPPMGGESLKDKLGILTRTPGFVKQFLHELRDADVVHVRCPANIALIAIVLLAFHRNPRVRWAKFGGDWQPGSWYEGRAYLFQRWWLNRGYHRGLVTINGSVPDQPAHVRSFLNPSLTDEDIQMGRRLSAGKELMSPARILYAGKTSAVKGTGRSVEIAAKLLEMGHDVVLDVAGDGPERPRFESLAEELRVQDRVFFHGWIPLPDMHRLYSQAHFVLMPSVAEGWPKVFSEGMAYGAVPISSPVGGVPYIMNRFSLGGQAMTNDTAGFAKVIADYLQNCDQWQEESRRGIAAADAFTYRAYLEAVKELLGLEAMSGKSPNATVSPQPEPVSPRR